MRQSCWRLVLVGTAILWAQPAPAQTAAKDYMPGCRNILDPTSLLRGRPPEAFYEAGRCSGAIDAVVWTWRRLGRAGCVPVGLSTDEVTRVVVQYIDERPDRHSEVFFDLAFEALQWTWPCPW